MKTVISFSASFPRSILIDGVTDEETEEQIS